MKTLISLVIALCIVIGMIVIIVKVQPKKQCVKEKEITQIESIPLANFWGKKIDYIIHYSDGTIYETEMGSLYGIGQKTCIEYR